MVLVERKEISFSNENTFGLRIFREVWHDLATDRQATYWKYSLPDMAQVIGFTKDQRVIAIEEFQPGTGETYLHIVGETMKQEEDPICAAERGLLEETGYKAEKIVLLSQILENTGRSDRLIHICMGVDCTQVQEPEEGITVHLYDPALFWQELMGYFTCSPSKRGAGNTLKATVLAFHYRHLLSCREEQLALVQKGGGICSSALV